MSTGLSRQDWIGPVSEPPRCLPLGVLSGVPTIGVGKSLHRVDGLTKGTVAALTAQLDRRAPSGRLGTGHRTGVGRRDPATATSTGHR